MIDFSKLGSRSPEEQRAIDEERERNRIKADLSERAGLATAKISFVLAEDPEIRYDRTGFPYAILRPADSKFASVTLRPLSDQEDRDFANSFNQLAKGDEVSGYGHPVERKWKNASGKWVSSQEFSLDVPTSPKSISPELPNGISMPLTAFQISENGKSAQLATQNGFGL